MARNIHNNAMLSYHNVMAESVQWYLVCENWLRIEAVGAKTKNKENIH